MLLGGGGAACHGDADVIGGGGGTPCAEKEKVICCSIFKMFSALINHFDICNIVFLSLAGQFTMYQYMYIRRLRIRKLHVSTLLHPR